MGKVELTKHDRCSAIYILLEVNMKKNCQICNKEFSKKQSHSKSAWLLVKYCSRECAGKNSGFKRGTEVWNKNKKGLQKAWNKGMKGFNTGEKSGRWIADRTKLAKRQERNDMAYKNWRKQVWLRDNFTCKIANPDCCGRIEAHHILGWTNYPELRYEVNNGITLCHFHHPRKRKDEMRLSPYFKNLVELKVK